MTMKRLLFVDDDRLVLGALAKGLRDAGYEVKTATSGEAALALAAAERFDLAILDIRMPGLSGIESAERLRAEYDLPTLFLTAYSERATVEQAVTDGGVGYVVKPVDLAQLVPAIECALARARDLKALIQVKAQLELALAGGRATSIAVGILMERRNMMEKTAFAHLRTEARKQNRKLESFCAELVAAAERLNEL